MPRHRAAAVAQRDLFVPAPAWPKGFGYGEEIIAPADEAALLRDIEALPFEPLDFHGFLAKRHVAWFGWRYDYAGGKLRDSEPIPTFLLPLRMRAAAFADVPPGELATSPHQQIRAGRRHRLAPRQADVW